MIVTGLDPAYAKPCAYSAWDNTALVGYGYLDWADEWPHPFRPDWLVYESTAYRGREWGLGSAVGFWAAKSGVARTGWVGVTSSRWRNVVLKQSEKKLGRAAAKKAACVWVQEQLGLDVRDDLAEALCIGYYGVLCSRVASDLRNHWSTTL